MLDHQMPNGATVSDWLGTAMTAARCAARDIEAARQGRLTEARLLSALENAEQTVSELKEVLAELGK